MDRTSPDYIARFEAAHADDETNDTPGGTHVWDFEGVVRECGMRLSATVFHDLASGGG